MSENTIGFVNKKFFRIGLGLSTILLVLVACYLFGAVSLIVLGILIISLTLILDGIYFFDENHLSRSESISQHKSADVATRYGIMVGIYTIIIALSWLVFPFCWMLSATLIVILIAVLF